MAFTIVDIIFTAAGALTGKTPDKAIGKPNGGEIYRIWFDNDPSGKCYVGQTIQGSLNRIRQHVEDAQSSDDGCPLLDAATRKFGLRHMRYEVLEEGIRTHEELDEAERKWIAAFNSQEPGGYNVKAGGQGKSSTPIVQRGVYRGLRESNPLVASVVEGLVSREGVHPAVKTIVNQLL